MLVFEKTRRQLRPDEAMRQKVVSLHALAAVKVSELVGKRRRRELGQTHPIRIIVYEAASRAAGVLTVAQRALALEMSDEIVLLHLPVRPDTETLAVSPNCRADLRRFQGDRAFERDDIALFEYSVLCGVVVPCLP